MNQLDILLDMVEKSQEEIVHLHQELVRIPTVNTGRMPTGNETELCHLLEQRFAAEGIDFETIESAPGRGNFIASLVGTSSPPRLLYVCHTDVVPIEEENNWIYPPFSGQIVEDKIFGRGSDDAKSLVTSGTMALFILKRARVKLRGTLTFLAAADEEAGGRYGVGWLAEKVPHKIQADYAINEGGGTPLHTKGGLAYLFSVGEKGRLEARIAVRGRSSHAARPWFGENAIVKTSEIVRRVYNYKPELDTSLEIFSHLGHLFDLQEPISSQNVDRIGDELSRKDCSLGSVMRGLSRMTISPTVIFGGAKSNSIPEACTLTCDIRTLPHQDEQYVEQQLNRIVRGIDGVNIELEHTAISGASPTETEFVNHIQKATEMALGRNRITWIPSITTGFTDSRFIRSLGTQVYGIAPITFESNPMREGVHGVNEAMEIENLLLRTKMQVILAYRVLVANH
jgi:acetylornithine deacetylase/succinyl-diaminopimelate desuccinylase-like protein